MPDHGRLSLVEHPDCLPVATGSEPGSWQLEDARVVSVTYEVTTPQMIELLPLELIRPVPAYVKIVVVETLDSPVGPYREAALFLGGREGIQIRNFLVDAIVEGQAQLAEARRRFGGSRRPGRVTLDWGEGTIRAAIADEDGALCELRLGRIHECDATMLKFDALQVAGTVEGQPVLLRYGLRIPLEAVEGHLSREWQAQMVRPGTVWHRLRPAFNVTAFATRGPARLEFAHPPARPPQAR
jgi:hypothetical protein